MSTIALPSASSITSLSSYEQVVYGYLARCNNPATYRAYVEDLKNFDAWCRQQQIEPLSVRRAHLDLYVRWTQAEARWSESTIARRIGTVCGMLRYAAAEDYITKDPSVLLQRPTVDRAKQRRTFLNPVEFAQLLKHAQEAGPTEHALIALLGLMGLRVGEACSLNVESITREAGYTVLRFIGKGNKAAKVVAPVPAMRALDDVTMGRTSGPILLNQKGERMDRAAAARMLRRLAKHAGVSVDITPHGLRRTFCTSGLLHKVDLYEMQLAMRHVSPSTTSLYDMAKSNLDRSATHQVAGFLAALAG